MQQYLDLLEDVLENGTYYEDRTGTGCTGVFGRQIRFNLKNNKLPVITTKKIHLKSVIHELLWFISGDTNIRYLRDNGINIWNEWADGTGNLGPVYGAQWRDWGVEFDQLGEVILDLRDNPYSRRHIVSAWNVADIPDMALPPCHMMFQFHVAPAYGPGDSVEPYYLSCHMYQRSADLFLGLPFNITSYALLTHMVAEVVGLKAKELIISIGDAHIYSNHIDQVNTQLGVTPYKTPTVRFKNKEYLTIDDFEYDDIIIEDYQHGPTLKGKVAV